MRTKFDMKIKLNQIIGMEQKKNNYSKEDKKTK